MTLIQNALRIAATLAAGAIVASGAYAQVQLPASQASQLKAPTTRQQVTPVPCNSVSACNQIIAYCVANNGTWIEQASTVEGQPSKGTCYLP